MTTDLFDLVENLKRQVNPPGTNVFPDATDDEFFGHLQDTFWEARLDSVISSTYSQDADGVVTPTLPGDLQQLVVLYAGIRILTNHLMNLNSVFRAQAGPVEFEQQKAASLLKAQLDHLQARRRELVGVLGENGTIDPKYVDAVQARETRIDFGDIYWVAF